MNEYAESDSVVYLPTREPEAIANAIEQAAQNIVQLTESALDNVHRYDAKVTIEQLASLYREINSQ
jgi:glycosyltransferase involved in cell wall biosynthesis